MSGTIERLARVKDYRPAQDIVVLALAVGLSLVCALFLPGFASTDNLVLLLRSVVVLGVLATALGLVVISGGLDLSVVSTAVFSSAIVLNVSATHGLALGVLAGFLCAALVGVVNAFLINALEIPAFFATLSLGIALYGLTRSLWVPNDTVYIPENAKALEAFGSERTLGVPSSVIVAALVLIAVQLFLTRTSYGRFMYAHGDNAGASRLTGIANRRIVLLVYVTSAIIACIAGLLLTAGTRQLDMPVATSSLVYNVLLVAVVGGVSLAGGRGSMLGVLAGTLLLGVLVNAMTLLNFDTSQQDIVTGVVLLAALVLDNRLHPRNEETARQGE